jgi:putative ABC transport system substrate-binding protein
VSLLVNPTYPDAEPGVREAAAAARSLGLQIQVFNASSSIEINAAFASLMRERPDALLVGSDPFLTSRRIQLVLLATRHAVPAIYETREAADVGGLMSYGTNIADAWRQVGGYAGRILKGAKPPDLPVVQSTRFELVINHVTANVLGLTVPPSLLARADEVIE